MTNVDKLDYFIKINLRTFINFFLNPSLAISFFCRFLVVWGSVRLDFGHVFV